MPNTPVLATVRSRQIVAVRRSSAQSDAQGSLAGALFVLERNGEHLYVVTPRDLGGSGSGVAPLIRSAYRQIDPGDDPITLSVTDGVVGGGPGTILLPELDDEGPQAWVVSGFFGDIMIDSDGGIVWDVSNGGDDTYTVPENGVAILLWYTGAWRVIYDSTVGGDGGGGGDPAPGVQAASVVLFCPTLTDEDLTPADGDTMYWVEHTPNLDAADPMTGLNDWTGREEFTWTEGWANNNDPTNVLILTTDNTWLPTVFAEVTPTGFTAIDVLGGQPVMLGCGGSPDFTLSTWAGWNVGDGNQGGAIDPTRPADYITPTGMLADWVRIVDRSGNADHRTLAEWARRNERRYYDTNLTTQPWQQTDADFGVAAEGRVHGHVTHTSTYVVDATLTFTSTVDVLTPGTGVPQFFIREVFRSIDPEYAGWYWGWNTPDVRCQVHGQIGGLPFVGFVDRDGYLLDADGATLVRVLQSGDYLIGTVTGVFQND